MSLYYKKIPGRDIIILHGLFGSHKNWLTVAGALHEFGNIYLPDARNHGDSPHFESHTLTDLTNDLRDFIQEHVIPNPVIIGHSMGGLTAMQFALDHPNEKMDLIIVDILPKNYAFGYQNEIQALTSDLTGFTSRQEIDKAISNLVPDPFIRQFLLMNLERRGDGYFWKINARVLSTKFQLNANADQNDSNRKSLSNVLFIMGGDSEYFDTHADEIAKIHFPNAVIKVIPGGNHYIHYSKYKEFIDILQNHLHQLNFPSKNCRE